MSFSFTIPYITFLGLTLLIIIGITIFLIRRMNNQNQKFSSIVGVVTSLAEELNSIKLCISNSINNISNISTDTKIINTNLIHVSDDEEDETDDEEEDEEETDDDDEEEEEDDEEDEDEDNTDINLDDKEQDQEEVQDVNVDVEEELLEEEKDVINENVKYIHLDHLQEDNRDIFEMIPEEIISTDPVPLEEQEDINLKSEDIIHGSTIVEETQQEELITDISIVKKEVIDYKKMSLTKLRTIVLEKGLSDNISKLKKNDLLQILESNLHN
jgi:hypothetical protein